MSRRQALAGIPIHELAHAGLWLDRMLPASGDDEKAKTQLAGQVAALRVPPAYHHFYGSWVAGLAQAGATTRSATVINRMAVGLGSESVLETSIALHRTYGVPLIPGSSLKGLAAAFARQQLAAWGAESPAYQAVFGTMASAGHITFYDALLIPASSERPLRLDVMTPHHMAYQSGTAPPTDFDAPTPVPFISATGSYLLALGGPEDWTSLIFDLLALALAETGIGAKTSSGYGRLTCAPPPVDPAQAAADALIADIQALRLNDVAQGIQSLYLRWRTLEAGPPRRRQVAQAIVAKVKEANRERAAMEKAWYQDLLASLNT